jgi:putative membrane protein
MSTEVSVPVAAVAAEEEWRRLSPRMLLVHPVKEFGRAIPALVAVFLAGSSSGNGDLWGLAGAGIVMALSVSRWFTTRYRVGADQVQIRDGLLRRRTLSARLDRVRTVDVTSHFLHRALGLARVEIGTGVSDRKGKSSLRLDGLPAADAARLRAELLHRSSAAGPIPIPGTTTTAPRADLHLPAGGAAEYAGAAHEVVIARLLPQWLRFAPFTLSGAFTGLVIAGFGWRLVSEGHVDLESFGPLHATLRQLERVPWWVAAVEVALALVVFVALASTGRYLLAFWNFRLTRHAGGSFHVERGLLTTRATSIEVSRLCGVTISEPLLLRSVGAARTTAIATGLDTSRGAAFRGQAQSVLLPDAPLAEARRVAGVVIDRPDLVDAPLVSHGAAARRRRYTRALAGACGLVAVVWLGWWLLDLGGWDWVLALWALPLAEILAADRARNLGHLVRNGYLVTQSGSLSRKRVMLATDAILGWNVQQSFFQRRAGVVTLVATTAAGPQSYTLLDITPEEARSVAEHCVPGLLAQFG